MSTDANFQLYNPFNQLLAGNGPFLPIFGGTMVGAITQPLAPVADTDLVNKTYLETTYTYGAHVFKSTASIAIPPGNIKAFSAGSTNLNVAGTDIGTSVDIDNAGQITIINNLSFTTYFRLTFTANKMSIVGGNYATLSFQFEEMGVPFGPIMTMNVLPIAVAIMSSPVYLTALVSINPTSFKFYTVSVTNAEGVVATLDSEYPDNPSIISIERVA
jgi:hypothetical protein